MKERTIGVIIAVIIGLLAIGNFFSGQYNSIIEREEVVKKNWADVEALYQQRVNLIGALLNTVKGFAKLEKDILIGVTEARSKASSIQIDPAKLSPQALQQFNEAQSKMGSAVSRLLVTVEAYPDIKSNQNFMDLQRQLQVIEDKIAVGRQTFNVSVQEYNTVIRKFPANIVASIFDFKTRPAFKAGQKEENVIGKF